MAERGIHCWELMVVMDTTGLALGSRPPRIGPGEKTHFNPLVAFSEPGLEKHPRSQRNTKVRRQQPGLAISPHQARQDGFSTSPKLAGRAEGTLTFFFPILGLFPVS